MTFLTSMAQTLERAFMNTAIVHTRQILLAQSERTLSEAGLSRELIERGASAWPWRQGAPARAGAEDTAIAAGGAADTAAGTMTPATERARRERLARAAEELGRLDDRELADLGIGRGDIARAVRIGREGIEYPDAQRADETSRRRAA